MSTFSSFIDSTYYVRDVVQILTVDSPGTIDIWQESAFCLRGSYSNGFSIKADKADDSFYDVKLRCAERVPPFQHKRAFIREIWAGEGRSGARAEMMTCHSSAEGKAFLSGFQIQKGVRHAGSEQAVTNIKFWCWNDQDSSEYELVNKVSNRWGHVSQSCPRKSAVCGIQTRAIEESQSTNILFVDVRIFCCRGFC